MTWNETSKGSSEWLEKKSPINVFRNAFGTYNTRGEIALAIHGNAGATVTRKDMEDYFGIRGNNFTEISKGSSNSWIDEILDWFYNGWFYGWFNSKYTSS